MRIEPGDDATAIIEAAPAGATITFGAGVHHDVTIKPKEGQTYIGEPGAIIQGPLKVTHLDEVSGVAFRDLTIRNREPSDGQPVEHIVLDDYLTDQSTTVNIIIPTEP